MARYDIHNVPGDTGFLLNIQSEDLTHRASDCQFQLIRRSVGFIAFIKIDQATAILFISLNL